MFDLSFLPDGIREKLMPFQRQGVQYAIEKQGRCLIGDEMGLGKTIQAIAVAYYYRAEWPLLIVLPSSMKYPWIEELEKWLPCLQPRDINLITSSTDISNISKAAISLIGYGLMQGSYKTLREALHKQDFKVIILDESHFLKNPKAARTKTLMPLLTKAKRVLMLSGTPALARPAELYPQINCLTGGEFGSWTSFARKYCDAKWKYFGRIKKWDTMGASNLPELHKRLTTTVMIRREKREVLPQLPPKRRQKVPFELAESPQKKELDSLWADLGLYLKGEAPADSSGTDAGFEIRRLAMQLYVSTGKAKIGAISEYIKMLLDNPEMKFLVFAHHKEILTAVVQTAQAYAREKEPSLKYIRIDGDVPPVERMKDVNRFQKDPNVRVAALSIMAAGTGITLTAASHVVFAELHWTPGVLEQCEDRAHRIGQLNAIHVHYLVARGTIDEWMWSALNRKVGVLSSTLNGRLQQLDAEVLQGGISDLLKQAAFWVPSDLDQEEDDSYFFSQTQKESRDIRSYLQPSQSRKKTVTLEDRFKDESPPVISLVDSDDSEDGITTNEKLSMSEEKLDQEKGEIDSFSDPGSEAEVTIPGIIGDNEAEALKQLPKTMGKGKDPAPCGAKGLGDLLPTPSSASVYEPSVGQIQSSPACVAFQNVCSSSVQIDRQEPFPQGRTEDLGVAVTSQVYPVRTRAPQTSTAASGSISSAGKTEQEQLGEKDKLQQKPVVSSRDLVSENMTRLHDSESSDSDCELIVGTRFSSRKMKESQRSQQSSCDGGTVSSYGTPASALDRRREPNCDIFLTRQSSCDGGTSPTYSTPSSSLDRQREPNLDVFQTPQSSRDGGMSSPHGTPQSALDRRRKPNDDESLTPSNHINNLEGKESFAEQWNCLACTFLNHKSLPLCEICDTPRRRAERQRRINTRSRVVQKQSDTDDKGSTVLETFSESDDDFEVRPRVVRLKTTAKRRSRDSLRSGQEEDNDGSVPDTSSNRNGCSSSSKIRDDDDLDVSRESLRAGEQPCSREGAESWVDERGTDSTLRMQEGVKDRQMHRDTVQKGRTYSMNESLDHGIDISDSDSDDSFLKVDVLRIDPQDGDQSDAAQRDVSERLLDFKYTKVEFTSVTSGRKENTGGAFGIKQEISGNLSGKRGSSAETINLSKQDESAGELSDALFSDEDSENLNQRSKPSPQESKVKPWMCPELSCKFINISSVVECENCWAPNPSTTEASTDVGGNAKVHNLGLRRSPGFVSASDLLARQGSNLTCNDSSSRNGSHGPSGSERTQKEGEADCESGMAVSEENKPLPKPKTYEAFLYCASKYTERIYLYDMDQKPLDCAFQPLDLRTRDVDNLPRLFQVPHNIRVARMFLREWDSLTEMKKRKLRKSGLIFDSPTAAVEALMKKRPFELSKRRFLTKDDLANAALQRAEDVGGSVRVIHRKRAAQTLTSPPKTTSLQFVKSPVGSRKRKGVSGDSTGEEGSSEGQEAAKKMRRDIDDDGTGEDAGLMAKSSFVQAVNADGIPLCVFCNSPVDAANLSNRNAAWDTRYCSENCKQENQIRWRNSKYVRQQLLEAEHGICQMCQLDAHGIFRNIKDVPKSKRKEFLSKTAYSSLSSKHLNEMIKNPSEGQGGGLCSMENFRTLCVLCHTKVTAEQSRERKDSRMLEANKKAGLRDIRKFLKDKG